MHRDLGVWTCEDLALVLIAPAERVRAEGASRDVVAA